MLKYVSFESSINFGGDKIYVDVEATIEPPENIGESWGANIDEVMTENAIDISDDISDDTKNQLIKEALEHKDNESPYEPDGDVDEEPDTFYEEGFDDEDED